MNRKRSRDDGNGRGGSFNRGGRDGGKFQRGGRDGGNRSGFRGRGGHNSGFKGRGGGFRDKTNETRRPAWVELTAEQIATRKAESKLNFDDLPVFSSTTELDVGIESFRTECPGFFGTLKQRYSDFLVNEIRPDGQVTRLTEEADVDTAKIESTATGDNDLHALVGADTASAFLSWFARAKVVQEDAANKRKERRKARGETVQQEVQKQSEQKDEDTEKEKVMLVEGAAAQEAQVEVGKSFTFPSVLSKEARTGLHQLIRQFWPLLSTDTIEGGSRGIRLSHAL